MSIQRAHLVQGVLDEIQENLPGLEEILGQKIDPVGFFVGFMACLSATDPDDPHEWFRENRDDVLYAVDAISSLRTSEDPDE